MSAQWYEPTGPHRRGLARVYWDPTPERGAHPGVRGYVIADALGVHYEPGAEWLCVDPEGEEDWPMGEWLPVDEPETLPWHRVYSIEWGGDA